MPTRLLSGPAPVVVLVALATLVGYLAGGFTDLYVYRHAGQELMQGESLRQADPVTGLPFTYPPFAALVLVPLALVPPAVAAGVWTGASVAALALAVRLVLRELGRPAPGWLLAVVSGAALCFEPVWQNLAFGQVNLLLMLAVLVDLLMPQRRWSGALLGIAVGVKLTPIVFVVLLVLAGRRVVAGRALAVFAMTVAVGYVVAPGAASAYWGERLVDASRVGPPALAHNQSVYGALTRLLDGEPSSLLWLAVAGPLLVAALALGARCWLRGDRVLGAGFTALGMLLASPVSWSHHWVWAVPIALALWDRSRLVCIAWTAVFLTRPFVWLPYGGGREYAWSWPEQVAGNAYLLATLALLGWALGQAASGTVSGTTVPGMTVGGHWQVSSHGR